MKKTAKYFFHILLAATFFVACSKKSEDTPTPIVPTNITVDNFETSINENPNNGATIGSITASSNQGTLNFALSNQNPAGALSINANTGEISVADASLFDYETRKSITATITASVDTTSRSATITINLNDLYDSGVAFDAIIEHWKFDGDFIGAIDNTRQLQQGDASNPVGTTTDRFGNANKALEVGTDGEYLSITNMPLVAGNNARAVSFWVKKPVNAPGFMEIFHYGNDSSNEIFSCMYAQEDANYYGFRRNSSGSGITYRTTMPTDTWQHVVINYSPTTATLFVNGTNVSSVIFSSTGLDTPANGTLKIGTGLGALTHLGFALDDLIFYNRALSEAEITELSQN
ncbi:MAG: LamG-like jellyroll fold domain-containing protein [Thermonemataceae bacterium]|nr:LamG-like jellyroll fold domain-containing protein [Thermonemataceae bacterium]